MLNQAQKNTLLVLLLIALIVVWRAWIEHLPNFAPTAAAALFASYYLKSWRRALMVPFLGMVISDLFLGSYTMGVMMGVYVGLAAPVFLAGLIKRNKYSTSSIFKKLLGVTAVVPVGTVLFFLISNFAEWQFGVLYAKTWSGLIACYTAAIPFLHYSLAGDLFFSLVFFGLYYLLVSYEEEKPGKRELKPIRVRSNK